MKTYRVPVRGLIGGEIDVQANSKEEAIDLSYEKINELDNNSPIIRHHFYYDTFVDDVEEVDEEVA